MSLRQATRSSGDNEFREARLLTFTLHHVAAFRNCAPTRARDRLFRGPAMAGSITIRSTSTRRVNKRLLKSFKPFLVSLSRSVPKGRIRLTFELVNERRRLTQPFEPLLGCQAVKFGMAVEILRSALGQRALEFFGRLDFSLLSFHFGAAISPVL